MKKETKKEWFLDRYCGHQFAALVENGVLTEFLCEKETRGAFVGTIYKGKVQNVVSGMNAAFVNCGLHRNCYLSMEENYTDYSKYDGTMVEMKQKKPLQVGDEIIVQLVQLPRGTKGAKVTPHLSFVGKRLIYLPNTSFIGISRKITNEEERQKLLSTAERLRSSEEEGFIVRTQAPFATEKQLKKEATYLKKLYKHMLKTAKNAPVGAVLYEDEDLPVRVMRDSFGESISSIYVGDEALYQRLSALSKLNEDIPERKLVKYTGERSMLEEYGIAPLLQETAKPTVALENGAYLVINPTEAMTVIDVNTGSFIGNKDLETTVFETNLVAAREIARQVRLRNIGGIIAVDFIDMAEEAHKNAVDELLTSLLALDNTKCKVLPMNELCVTLFTRKRVGDAVLSYLVKPCAHCGGIGDVPDDLFVITRLRSAILDCFAEGYTAAIIDINEQIMKKILSEGMFSTEAKGRWKDKRVYFIPHKTYKEEHFVVRGEKESILNLPNNAQILY